MTYDQLKQTALIQFAQLGYEGASLSVIANEVGIKKQSIYTHFKSKDDLYIQTFQEATDCEIDFVKQFIEDQKSLQLRDVLSKFLTEYLERFENNNNMKFFMRTSFYPPVKHEEVIKMGSNEFVDRLESLFTALFEQNSDLLRENITPETAALAFLTILDGLLVELIYGIPERLQKRSTQSWIVFWRGISNESGES
ncbi:TetR/AcrR family transcriptional regulator [Fictibacillus sp. 18YEL24]|uniref:TetR/AcrR family transcriptional regulator n=1 Tax=Fictibacillus sp. 18YEL24 TaxID=2745875 RepID=UPI0018CD9E9C|nr:TetR/AcrR family transcriptional regulator [Fictibacillus sp. 18YEL24]MBH0168141.1 TetR/AcrR family transcriptional regulator [Fictibacillus sp. 18YEL24]